MENYTIIIFQHNRNRRKKDGKYNMEKSYRNTIKKKFIAFVTLMFSCILMACGTSKIDVMEKITLQYNGCNGNGIALIENPYTWEQEALEKSGVEDTDDISSMADTLEIESAVSFEVYPNENLSNGDEVIVKAVYDNKEVEKYKIKFTGNEKKFTVSGLPEIQTIDLFEKVEVTFDGIAPYVTATINKGNAEMPVYTNFEIDKNRDLNIGDIVTVTAKYDENTLSQSGYQAKSSSKEFKVGNMAKYVTDINEIPEDMMKKMQKQMEDAMKAYVADKWAEEESMSGMNFMGTYLLNPKEGRLGEPMHYLYLVYKIDVKNSEGSFSYYTYCQFRNMIILEDGTCSLDLSDYQMPKGSGWGGMVTGEAFNKGKYFYLGYEDLDSMFNNCVVRYLANYEYSTTVVE